MKKVLIVIIIIVGCLFLQKFAKKEGFYILNWAEYMNPELLDEFSEEYNIEIIYVESESNELMYSQIIDNYAPYDIIFPSDYMIEKLHDENLLLQLDYTKLSNYQENMFTVGLNERINNLNYKDYFIPYFWGSLGIMYNTNNPLNEQYVKENGWNALFNQRDGANVAMYDVSRDAFAAAQMSLGININSTDENELNQAKELLMDTNFKMWGTDELKRDIATGVIDYGLVYSGDFFDQFYTDSADGNEITYDIYAPTDRNNIFFDGMCIPKNSQNVDLAYKFVDFFLNHENSLSNAEYVGYAPTLNSVYENVKTNEDFAEIIEFDAFDPNNILNVALDNAVIYRNLGNEFYSKMEIAFTEIRS